MGDLGGGVKAQGSGDAGTAGQGQAGQTSHGLFSPGREPNSRSGAVTTVTLAVQVAAQAAYLRCAQVMVNYTALGEASPAAAHRCACASIAYGVRRPLRHRRVRAPTTERAHSAAQIDRICDRLVRLSGDYARGCRRMVGHFT